MIINFNQLVLIEYLLNEFVILY